MLINYLKIAFRSIIKYKGYTAINLIGLALGLASGILIFIYVIDELSFDKFHAQGDRTYRVLTSLKANDDGAGMETNGWPIGDILKKDFPEVEAVVYMRNSSYLQVRQDNRLFVERSFFASDDFFRIFSFPLVEGNPRTALHEPYTVVLTKDLAKKFFPGSTALGKTLILGDTIPYLVTGVMDNVPAQSHMQFGMLVSFASYMRLEPRFGFDGGWGNINMRNYVLLKKGVDVDAFQRKARNIYMDRVGEQLKGWGMEAYVLLEPLKKIYLETRSGNGMGPLGSLTRLYLVSGIATFVILLACINFINLSTARSAYRAREVGLRKVVGSSRSALVRQFLTESFLFTVLSFVIALAFLGLALPVFNAVVDKSYQLKDLLQMPIIGGLIVLIISVTVLAGYYPAWIISGVRPADVLKGKLLGSSRGIQLRRTLVVFQFVISVGLVISTIVVLRQLDFMRNENLGFDKQQVLGLSTARVTVKDKSIFGVFKNDLKSLAAVSTVTNAGALPGRTGWAGQVSYSENTPKEQSVSVEYMPVDEDYIKTLGLTVIAGRDFDENRELDRTEGLVINEEAARQYGWNNPEDAINKKITSPSGYPAGTVIGVVKDYHQLGLQQKIGPVVLDVNPQSASYYGVRFHTRDIESLLRNVEALWKNRFPENEFNYFFLDEDFERQYQAEARLGNVFRIFSGLTILIAVIGLLGMVSFMVTARTKEIGIRKVLGAGVLGITRMLSREFVILAVVANLVALPIAWYFAQRWLQGFAFRMQLDAWIFVLPFGLTILITIITISFQTIKAAMLDPVNALRYE